MTLICAPIMEKNIKEIPKIATEYTQRGADILEIRIDAIKNPSKAKIKELAGNIQSPFIATNRSSEEGGLFKGSEKERIELLAAAAEEAEYVDIELRTKKEELKKIIELPVKKIISYHNFHETPTLERLSRIVKEEKRIGHIAKVAVMPNTIKDTLTILELSSKEDDLIAISMGELGKYTRIITPLFGSPITYATGGKPSAPGQLEIEKTRLILKELKPKEKIV
ncbi:3-dehydroquinase [Methanothermobacter tenebrarum]|uniref:3-dehydroquinate dehydratase n=1 Tax=Methanothermobacter tenebrarum TaxID=680118 RepID=A0ABN6PBL9_9EURY|nr:type I 3-dehydroquinate dehydratase [Methanothermobacter tenebrarum]MDD3455116.1 type I 3-dehydroquinate dehydratase [Methanobacteriales archaeon]MDI6881346.1 type I 3-dehydroquinate dehydratase [Methanothermobacter sp.]MDX9693929.1 type I 3-dehydroquinate dehydratase [Methanothermobacter sp.]BDH79620.1 3-dehydroquinase [Methanothermobacter tenebrarum]HOQ20549.1 type I 3-dehydroquinate dehydratase [Methanothermobacter sp.]